MSVERTNYSLISIVDPNLRVQQRAFPKRTNLELCEEKINKIMNELRPQIKVFINDERRIKFNGKKILLSFALAFLIYAAIAGPILGVTHSAGVGAVIGCLCLPFTKLFQELIYHQFYKRDYKRLVESYQKNLKDQLNAEFEYSDFYSFNRYSLGLLGVYEGVSYSLKQIKLIYTAQNYEKLELNDSNEFSKEESIKENKELKINKEINLTKDVFNFMLDTKTADLLEYNDTFHHNIKNILRPTMNLIQLQIDNFKYDKIQSSRFLTSRDYAEEHVNLFREGSNQVNHILDIICDYVVEFKENATQESVPDVNVNQEEILV